MSHYTSFIAKQLQVRQLNGSTVKALGYGLKLIQCPTTKIVLPLWPTYYMPSNPQCTFSPTALKHYLHFNVITHHLTTLSITTTTGHTLVFPSINPHKTNQLLDYHQFVVVRPINLSTPRTLPIPIINSATSEAPLNRLLVHQRLGHGSDEVLDTMCRKQSLLGLPKQPYPARKCPCIICITTKTTHPPKAKSTSYVLTSRGQLLHMDFSFWNQTSYRGFTSLLSIIDGKNRMLWNFPTANKRPPLAIITYFFSLLAKENITIKTIRVDEDGALANSSEFTDLLVSHNINMETTGGFASFLNGKIERPHRTIAQHVRAMLLNSGLPSNLWCYAAETQAEIYRYTYHSAIDKTPYEAWYGIKPNINNLRVWGCYVYVRVPQPKKLDHRVVRGHFLGFTKSRLIVRWYDPSTKTVKHASAIRFDEYNTPLTSADTLSPGALILSGTEPSIDSSTCIDIIDHPHLGSHPFSIQLQLPPKGSLLGCTVCTDTYHNLPYIHQFNSGLPLGTALLKHGQHNSSFWILSINSHEFITAKAVIDYIQSLQQPGSTTYIQGIFARRLASNRTSLAGNRVLFNQIRFTIDRPSIDDSLPPTTIVPVGMKVVFSPIRPDNPKHFGETLNTPFAADWRDALFQNYDKMMTTGTFSAPLLRSSVPSGKSILRPRIACRVKDTSVTNQFDLYARCCADGSTQKRKYRFSGFIFTCGFN